MNKFLFSSLAILLFSFNFSTAQELPKVIPPSPTVASLMQFEEVPVSHYTGQPNISIPLYSKAMNSELGINIALSYNTQGIKINNRSGWVGTGWSLEAGGVISRTVRGTADEKPKGDATFPGPATATGVFHNDDYWNFQNPLLVNQGKFGWRANGTPYEKYDYESDLFQFNALGLTGRFVIVKENGALVPKLLTRDQNIKIEIDYGTPGGNAFSLNAFTIIDTKGNRFTFSQQERIYSDPLVAVEYFGGNQSLQGQGTQGTTTNAWYLTKIETSNSKELARFEYQEIIENYTASITRTYREITPSSTPSNWNNMIINSYNPGVLPAKRNVAYYTTTAYTQKLSKVIFRDSTRIEFLVQGSHPETGGAILKDILIKDVNLAENKRFTLNYDTNPQLDRLWLTSVDEKAGLETNTYTLEYIDKEGLPPFDSITDAWGYNEGMSILTFNSYCNTSNPFDKSAIKKGLLQKIIYPTGGGKEFTFEHNTITYQSKIGALGGIGTSNDTIAVALPDIKYQELNPDNWVLTGGQSYSYDSDVDNYAQGPPFPQTNTFTIAQTSRVVFNISNINVDLTGCSGDTEESVLSNSLIKILGTGLNSYETNIRLSDLDQDQLILDLNSGTYEIRFYMLNNCARLTFDLCYNNISYTTQISKFIYGGGVRIKSIVFKDDDQVNTLPSRKISYDYRDVGDFDMSSGAIDGDINGLNLSYTEEFKKHLFNNEFTCVSSNIITPTLYFNVFTKGLNVELTQGSYVGYKTVSVSEEDNGFTRYTFTSPQDYANQTEVFNYPDPLPPKNLDFKRGLLLKKQVFRHNTTPILPGVEPPGKLSEVENSYDFVEEDIAPSYRLYRQPDCLWAMYFHTYDNYDSSTAPENPLNQCFGFPNGCDGPCFSSSSYISCGDAPYYLVYNPVESGWAKLAETVSRDYFYDENDVQSQTETSQTFTYNALNFQIAEQATVYEEDGNTETLTTKYYYPLGGLPPNYNGSAVISRLNDLNKINEVVGMETYRNGTKLSQTNTNYFEPETDVVVPLTIETAKESDLPQERIQFYDYDDLGNPLELSKTNGTHIIYVWGYQKTLPIAKIENASYTGMSTGLQNTIATAVTASNNDVDATTEASLKTALEAIRTHPDLQDAMVTTLTYDPLKGATSVTDPRGYIMTYVYDDLNRLESVKDKDGYLVNKNSYYYRGLTANENYVQSISYQVGTTTGSVTDDEKIETRTYLDGLGRPKQTIVKQGGGNKQDIITPVVYDDYGRQPKEYLPYANASQTPGTGSLAFRNMNTLLNDLEAYYLAKYPEAQVNATTINAYSEKHFEDAPLNRILEQGAPGKFWQVYPNSDTDHSVKFDYQTNTTADAVKLYRVTFTSGNTEAPELSYVGTYDAGELYKTITKDENWTTASGKDHTVEEYKDKQGRVILKRTYDSNTAHDTQYVYDDFGNLTYVLSPEGSDAVLDGSNNVIQTILEKLCYQYRYDKHNRLVEKRIPGKDWEYIIYDRLDRPFLTQDANLRVNGRWLITKYDAFSRVAYTGLYWKDGYHWTRTEMQGVIDNVTFGSNTVNEVPLSTPITVDNTALYYTNDIFPQVRRLYTVNYYDTYNAELTAIASNPGTVYSASVTSLTQSLATGTKIRALDTNDWIISVTYYDEKGRAIYVKSKNDYLSTVDLVETDLDDFNGRVLETETTHTRGTNPNIVTIDLFTYDHAGRLLTQKQKISGEPQELIVKNEYDELGQLVSKGVGNTEASPLQTVDYSYNIRGWLKKINDPATLGTDLFAFQINYNEGGISNLWAPNLYNGNIGLTHWITANDNTKRAYSYAYDDLNRITAATFKSGPNLDQEGGKFQLYDVRYDKNGNLLNLTRNGVYRGNASQMDKLTYSYDGNQLLKVDEAVTWSFGEEGFKDGTNIDNDYTYDANGNMTEDKNKDISGISYNHLNLPTKITIGKDGIEYVYDATGVKLQKRVSEGGTTVKTDYAGNYIYEITNAGDRLKFFSHPEGYVEVNKKGEYDYVYQYKDHLGNIRLSYSDYNDNGSITTSEIIEENNYYPFGLKHKGYNNVINGTEYNYKTYQGQEFTKNLDLNIYEWKYRFGDPATARFWQVDPLAEDYLYNGVYNFSENDPVSSVELEGLEKLSVQVYNLIKNNDGSYTARFDRQVNYDSREGEWSGIKSQYQLQVLDSYDRKTVTNLYSGDNALADAKKDGVNISEWQNREVSASDIWEGAKNNPRFQKAGETLRNVGIVASFIFGPELLVERVAVEIIAGVRVYKTAKQTKSSLNLGNKMHKAYRSHLEDKVSTFKEFVLPSKSRIDFLDIENGIIYELKPNNPRAIKEGIKQLERYKKELESMDRFKGIEWKTVLDTY